MDMQLNGKQALVTGATAGIGLEIARKLAAEGASVAITGRDRAKLDAAIAGLEGSGAKGVTGIAADAATEAGAAMILKARSQIDILVNNLGIYESRDFVETGDDDWRRYFEVNVMSGVRLARAYLPAMLKRDSGRIIFISSESGVMIPSDMIHYAMTKSAQLSIARGLAGLTKGTRVTVNAVMPGPTRSEGIVDFLRSVASNPDAPAHEIEAEFFAKSRSSSLLQRMVEPEEVANMVTYLASPLSAATNGAALRVEGGIIPTLA
jgi:NAD(P)-dependent dehydrogenase (short-subunit alcohol dehydrogenase family)